MRKAFKCGVKGYGLLAIIMVVSLTGCSLFTGRMTQDFADNLAQAIKNNNDLTMVKEGSPAYLIMIDGLVRKNPENPSLLRTAAILNATYSELFVVEEERSLKLTKKALDYALKANCAGNRTLCGLDKINSEQFNKKIASVKRRDLPSLYALGASWAAWINARKNTIEALTHIPKIKIIMEQVLELDEGYMDGSAHIYLGTIETILPPILGGNPNAAKKHFERVIELSGSSNLMAKVLYAKQYARIVYNRQLHDKLLHDVLKSATEAPGYTLMNTMAKIEAQELLNGADDYF